MWSAAMRYLSISSSESELYWNISVFNLEKQETTKKNSKRIKKNRKAWNQAFQFYLAVRDKNRSFWDIENSLSHERGSERSEQAQRRARAKRAVRSKRTSERCPRTSEQAKEGTDERVAQYLCLYSCLFQTTVQRPLLSWYLNNPLFSWYP